MRLVKLPIALTLALALAGCGTRNPAAPILEPSSDDTGPLFVLSSALDARLPAPMEEARDAGPADLAIADAAGLARREGRGIAAAPVVFWSEFTTTLARGASMPPPRFARAYALVHVAINDAVVAGHARGRGGLRGVALAAGAASTVLTYLFPQSAAEIAAAAQAQLAGEERVAVLRSWRLGTRVGDLVVAHGRADGSDTPFTGAIPTGPGIWNGTNPVLPMCGEWQTWILRSGDDFQPAPPYAFGSPEDLADMAQVLDVALHRTPEQVAIVHKWADRSPPAIWCSMLNQRLVERHFSLGKAAAAAAFLNVAMYDAFVSCWSSKYRYWIARPHMRITDPAFTTVIPTPNFPTYTSGHSTISAAAAEVMAALFPAEAGYMRGQAAEAALSRLWAGIHFSHDNEEGLRVGRRIGAKTVRAMRHGRHEGPVAEERRD